MGMIKLSVRDYMSSLHNFVEKPNRGNWKGDENPASTPKSISEMLKLCEADPIELLIDLGFGIDEPDICTKIPSRFIMTPSEAKGINTRVFLDAQKRRMEIESPNLHGRFRRLEVLEQVTNTFSTLLNNIHATKNGGDKNAKKSTITAEKRKRIRQLIWKFSKQVKNPSENPSSCMKTAECIGKQDQQDASKTTTNVKIFRKKRPNADKNNLEVSAKDLSPALDNGSAFRSRQESKESTLPTPVKQYNLLELAGKNRTLKQKVLSETFRKSSQNKLQPPDSFEMEEVQSFEEEYPKVLNQERFLEMTRTSSCQSDSSGFLEELPESLQNRHGSSDSIDSQVTLHGKSNFSDIQDTSEDNNNGHGFAASLVIEGASVASSNCMLDKNTYKSLSVNTENNMDVFQSFESHSNYVDHNMKEMDKQISTSKTTENATEKFAHDVVDQTDHKQAHAQDSPEYVYPVYVTHYLSDISEKNPEENSTINEKGAPDCFEGHVSDLQDKSYSSRASLADDECSVDLPGLKWTLSPTSISESFSFKVQTPYGSLECSDEELEHSYHDIKSTFQTEVKTNMYKSVTIQMPPSLMRDTANCTVRQHSVYDTTENKQGQVMNNCVEDRMDAFSQTETGWMNRSFTNNHCSHQRSCFLTESLSFDIDPLGQQQPLHPALNISCCHCCHHHSCCMLRCQMIYRQNITNNATSANISLEKELSDTLSLLRESLINMSVKRDSDMENMKRACQRYREKLVEIEQLLQEQQAGCFNILTSEEKENMRRLHLLRRNVLKEATELECNLDERAQHVKESISLQLEEVLDEQSRLYSELELCNMKQACDQGEHSGNLHKDQNAPSTSTSSVPTQESVISNKVMEESKQLQKTEQSQKTDLSMIIQNIKKAFRSFNNS